MKGFFEVGVTEAVIQAVPVVIRPEAIIMK